MREPLIKALRLGIDISGFDAQTQIAKSFLCDELPKMLLAQSNGIDKYDNIITCLSTDEMIASTIISATKLGSREDNMMSRLEAKINKLAKNANPHVIPKII